MSRRRGRNRPFVGTLLLSIITCGGVAVVTCLIVNPTVRDRLGIFSSLAEKKADRAGSKRKPNSDQSDFTAAGEERPEVAVNQSSAESESDPQMGKVSGSAENPFASNDERPGVASLSESETAPQGELVSGSSEEQNQIIANREAHREAEQTLQNPAREVETAENPFSDFETGEVAGKSGVIQQASAEVAIETEPATEEVEPQQDRKFVRKSAPRSVEESVENAEPIEQAKHELSKKPELSSLDSGEPQEYRPRKRKEEAEVENPEVGRSEEGTFDLDRVRLMIREGEEAKAHQILSSWYWKFPENRELFQKDLEDLAHLIYFSPQPYYGEPYLIQPGDRLSNIAEEYQVSWRYLSKLNQVNPRKIRAGKKLKVFQGPFSASIDLSDFELTVHQDGLFVRKYKIGVGKQNSTPVGEFLVRDKLENPTYYGPDGNVSDADDPLNPLGERWIDLGDGYGIHGTLDPKSIGGMQSKGCIRMLNSDVEEVYDLLTLGSSVKIQR